MRHSRWIVLAWFLLLAVAFAGWRLFGVLSPESDRGKEVTDQADVRGAKAEPDIYGVVKSVDAAHSTITLSVALEDGKEQETTYELANDVQVLLDGPATLDELATETRVALEFKSGQKEVAAIRSEPFRITIKPKQDEVEVNIPFDVQLSVVNASASPQSFRVMSCSWWLQWQSSNLYLSAVGWSCKRNIPFDVKLAPGKAYEQTLPMRATRAGNLPFRMGFVPLEGKSLLPSFEGKRVYWSTKVTLKVNEGEEKK